MPLTCVLYILLGRMKMEEEAGIEDGTEGEIILLTTNLFLERKGLSKELNKRSFFRKEVCKGLPASPERVYKKALEKKTSPKRRKGGVI
jgi:hypothetical protein